MEWGTECVCGRIPITLTESVAGGGGEASDPLQSLTGVFQSCMCTFLRIGSEGGRESQ